MIQISLRIRAVWSESLLGAAGKQRMQCHFMRSTKTLIRLCRLIWVFVGCTSLMLVFLRCGLYSADAVYIPYVVVVYILTNKIIIDKKMKARGFSHHSNSFWSPIFGWSSVCKFHIGCRFYKIRHGYACGHIAVRGKNSLKGIRCEQINSQILNSWRLTMLCQTSHFQPFRPHQWHSYKLSKIWE